MVRAGSIILRFYVLKVFGDKETPRVKILFSELLDSSRGEVVLSIPYI